MLDPDAHASIRILDRASTLVGWLGQPPQTPAWNVVTDEAAAGVWAWRRAAGLFTEYQKAKAWRGLRPEMVPVPTLVAAPVVAATRTGDTRSMAALVSADGAWRVEPIMLDQGNGPRLRYRITRWGVHVATVARVEDIGRHVDLAELSEEPERP